MKKTDITDIEGIYSSGCKAGIKKDKLDLAYIHIPDCSASAGVYTENKCCAACVDYNRQILASHPVKALIINSGNANAVTGQQGVKDVKTTAHLAAEKLSLKPDEVAVASTGIIGVPLPMNKITVGLSELLSDPELKNGDLTAQAIMTTDTCTKKVFIDHESGNINFSVAGIAKGSGMIAPNMATMFGFLVTDFPLPRKLLQENLKTAVDMSFNMCSVDTDTSTNDMVLIFSTGKIDTEITEADRQSFQSVLNSACTELAKQIARDGEGATKLIEAEVSGAASLADARKIAKSIIDSPLVKTAVHGADPNWGRIIMAVGKTPDVKVKLESLDCQIQELFLLKQGAPVEFDRNNASELMKSDSVQIKVNLNQGTDSARAWGCDLTKGYVDINTEYN